LIFEPAAATEAAVEFVGAAGLLGAEGRLAGDGGCTPTSCSNALKAFPNRPCADAGGTWAAVLVLVESDKGSTSELFL
jgi:hypothetical protein